KHRGPSAYAIRPTESSDEIGRVPQIAVGRVQLAAVVEDNAGGAETAADRKAGQIDRVRRIEVSDGVASHTISRRDLERVGIGANGHQLAIDTAHHGIDHS